MQWGALSHWGLPSPPQGLHVPQKHTERSRRQISPGQHWLSRKPQSLALTRPGPAMAARARTLNMICTAPVKHFPPYLRELRNEG